MRNGSEATVTGDETDGSTRPVIIEVAVNGVTTKARNARVPVEPEEIAADTIACLDAGATVVHTHAANRPGAEVSPEATAEEYARAYRLILAERPDAILYPTMGYLGTTIEDRFDHHRMLAAEGLIRCGVLDPGSTNLASFGPDGLPPDTEFVYANPPHDVRYMMATSRGAGHRPESRHL